MRSRASAWLLVASALGLPPGLAAATLSQEPLAARVEPVVRKFMAQHAKGAAGGPPAVSLAIGRDGTLLYADGFGDAARNQPATARTIYLIASITKQFTAAAVLRLIEEGARSKHGSPLSLQSAVADLLDSSAWTVGGWRAITIKDLLSMTSGLPNYTIEPPPGLDPFTPVSTTRLLDQLKGLRPTAPPGTFAYTNTGYFLLSELVERVDVNGTSRTYRQILKDEVFARLGLKDSGFETEPSIRERLAEPHYRQKPRFAKPEWLKGCGDVASSVVDLFKWDKSLIEGGVLSPEMRDLMFSDEASVDAHTFYGMGWYVAHTGGGDRYFHRGTVSGYTSFSLIVRPTPAHWLSVSLLSSGDGLDGLDGLEGVNAIRFLVLLNLLNLIRVTGGLLRCQAAAADECRKKSPVNPLTALA